MGSIPTSTPEFRISGMLGTCRHEQKQFYEGAKRQEAHTRTTRHVTVAVLREYQEPGSTFAILISAMFVGEDATLHTVSNAPPIGTKWRRHPRACPGSGIRVC